MTERFKKLEALRHAGMSDTEMLFAFICAMSDKEFEEHYTFVRRQNRKLSEIRREREAAKTAQA